MFETLKTVFDIAVVVGLVVYCWSVSSSLQAIAEELRQISGKGKKEPEKI